MNTEPEGAERRKVIQAVVVLAAICLGSGLGVGLVYVTLKDGIQKNEHSVFQKTLGEVLGEASSYDTVGDYDDSVPPLDRIYANQTDEGLLYAGTGRAQGYQSEIVVLVSVAADRPKTPLGDDPVIHRVAVVSSQETPGLGENVKNVQQDVSVWGAVAGQRSAPKRPWFQEQFSQKRLSDLHVVKQRGEGGIVAVTGATITSEAVTQAVRDAVKRIIERTRGAYGR